MNPNYEILFEPVKIGPVTAPNRFYQVPHANGMTKLIKCVETARLTIPSTLVTTCGLLASKNRKG